MNKRAKPSGYENRKRKQQKLQKLEDVKRHTKKIDTIFKNLATPSETNSEAPTNKDTLNVNLDILPSSSKSIVNDENTNAKYPELTDDGPDSIQQEQEKEESQNNESELIEIQSEEDSQYEEPLLHNPSSWPRVLCQKFIDRLIVKGPSQVRLQHYPENQYGRHFSESYYLKKLKNGETVTRRWLLYEKSKDCVFCFCCKVFETASSSNFVINGYNDWTHLSAAIKIHETSASHMNCYRKWIETKMRLKTFQTIDRQEQLLLNKEVVRWRNVLSRLLHITLYLAENNMAFRGSSDRLYTPNNGKFLGLVQMVAKFDPVMQEHLKLALSGDISDHYCGKRIQNEIIHLMAEKVTFRILEKIKTAKYYSIIADCTPDNSHVEQLSITIRIVDISDTVAIREYFIQFLNIDDTTGLGLTAAIMKVLEKHGLKLADCRGQGYDNGSNMKGKNSGGQKRILDQNPLAFFVPCGCHSYNLLLADAATSSVQSVTLFGVLQRLFTLFSGSTARWQILMSHVKIHTLKKLSDTRWEARIHSVKAVRYQLEDIHDALVTLAERAEKSDPNIAHEAVTLCNQLKDFSFIVSLIVWYDILFQVNVVSKSLQSEGANLIQAKELLSKCCKYLNDYRKNGFVSALSTAKEMAGELNIEPVFREHGRIRRIKRQFDEIAQDQPIQTPQKKFEIQFFNSLLDTVTNKLNERFVQFHEFFDIWGFLFDFKNLPDTEELVKCCADLAIKLTVGEDCDIDGKALREELISIKAFLPASESTTSPNIVLRFIQEKCLQDLYPNVWITLRILLTIPVTVASGERSFSKLKLVKTYLRTTMLQDRLNDLAILSIENDLAESLDIEELIQDFADQKARKESSVSSTLLSYHLSQVSAVSKSSFKSDYHQSVAELEEACDAIQQSDELIGEIVSEVVNTDSLVDEKGVLKIELPDLNASGEFGQQAASRERRFSRRKIQRPDSAKHQMACKNNHPLLLSTVYVLTALKDFVTSYYKQVDATPTVGERLVKKRITVSRLVDDKDIEDYWLFIKNIYSESNIQVCNALSEGLMRYLEILKERKNASEEVLRLRKRNEDLKRLLAQYMDHGVLVKPPCALQTEVLAKCSIPSYSNHK